MKVIVMSYNVPIDGSSYIKGFSDGCMSMKNNGYVLVVRCGECKWYKEGELLAPNKFCFRLKDRDGKNVGYNFDEHDFCSYGERRIEDGTLQF